MTEVRLKPIHHDTFTCSPSQENSSWISVLQQTINLNNPELYIQDNIKWSQLQKTIWSRRPRPPFRSTPCSFYRNCETIPYSLSSTLFSPAHVQHARFCCFDEGGFSQDQWRWNNKDLVVIIINFKFVCTDWRLWGGLRWILRNNFLNSWCSKSGNWHENFLMMLEIPELAPLEIYKKLI